MPECDVQQYQVLEEYDGEFCRVFLVNSTCLTGYVTRVGDWIIIEHPNKNRCAVQLRYVISVSRFEPRN